MPADQIYCTCCGRALKGKIVWLELDQRTQTYTDEGTVPAEFSLGGFTFGPDCAERKLGEHHDAKYAMRNVL